MLLRSHHYFTGKDIDIWVDDEIALVCDRYLQLIEHLPSSVRNFAQNQPLFWDRKVKPRVGRVSELQWVNRQLNQLNQQRQLQKQRRLKQDK
jgi:Cft2 family RNA processing exonuclease